MKHLSRVTIPAQASAKHYEHGSDGDLYGWGAAAALISALSGVAATVFAFMRKG